MARMLRKSKTLGWEACPCVACRWGTPRGRKLWRRIARRREEREWLKRDAS